MSPIGRLLISRAELLESLGRSDDWLKRQIKAGKLPGPWNGTTMFDVAAVKRAIAIGSGLPPLDGIQPGMDDPVARDAAELDRRFASRRGG